MNRSMVSVNVAPMQSSLKMHGRNSCKANLVIQAQKIQVLPYLYTTLERVRSTVGGCGGVKLAHVLVYPSRASVCCDSAARAPEGLASYSRSCARFSTPAATSHQRPSVLQRQLVNGHSFLSRSVSISKIAFIG